MAYDLLLRRRTSANWARGSSLSSATTSSLWPSDPFKTPKALAERRAVKQLKLAADQGDPQAKKAWARKREFLLGMKLRAAGGYPDSAYCKRAMEVLAEDGVVISGSRALSCGANRNPNTVKGTLVNGRRVSSTGRFVSQTGQARGFAMYGGSSFVGGPDDPLTQLPGKERAFVLKLVALRKKADVGDAAAQRVVETVAKLQIFDLPKSLLASRRDEPAKL